jgi:RND family efflux transporter MFP subunit
MPTPDISKLTIRRDGSHAAPRRPWARLTLVAAAIAGALWIIVGVNRAVTVETTSVSLAYPSQGVTLINATGYVVASRKAAVASKGSGRLEWLGVTEGSRVKLGEVIARLENKDVAAQTQQAQAGVRVAQGQKEQAQAELRDASQALNRAQDLFGKGFIAESARDAAIARHDKARAAVSAANGSLAAAEANLRSAQVVLDYTAIRAPFDGVVLTKHANVGDVVTPFTSALETKGAVVTMADMATLEVEADVSESSLHKVSVDQPCEIQLDAIPDTRFAGKVARIVPTVDRAKATVLVKVSFVQLDPRVLPDMSAKVAFLSRPLSPRETQPRTVVNPAAVLQREGKSVAFVVKSDKVAQVSVVSGERIGDLLEIKSGLKVGDSVVLKPGANLKNDARIKTATK